MKKIHIKHTEGDLYFDKFKRSEILLVTNGENKEVFVNFESEYLNPTEIPKVEKDEGLIINKEILFAIPKIQITNLNQEDYELLFSEKISIEKGWADEFKSCGIYVGWGIETFNNFIELKFMNDSTVSLKWTCTTDDFDNEIAETKTTIIETELDVIRFSTKKEFWDYETDKMNGIK